MARVVGRDVELARLTSVLDHAREHRSGVLVVRGDPGIGKTTLLDELAAGATDCCVLRVAGCEPEQDLTYAALHRLLGPILNGYLELPDPQRRALGAAFGLLDGLTADRFLLSLAVLSLITAAAAEQPVVVLVDDAHLVDDGTLAVLSFVARRLDADRVAVVFVHRGDRDVAVLDGLPHLTVAGLPDDAVPALLREATGIDVDHAVVDRLVAATGGSPLALVEISGLLTTDQLAARVDLPDPLPIGSRLEAYFESLVHSVPDIAQQLLLVAAAGNAPADHAFIPAAATALGAWPEGLAPVEAAGLLHLDPAPRFRHPLVRSVIYAGAAAADRRQAHRALAEAADGSGHGIRAAWHFGLATSGPDEAIAARLDAVADDVLARGGCGTAAAFRLRATELSPHPTQRVERGLLAAENLLLSGSARRARELFTELTPHLHESGDLRGQGLRLDGRVRYATGEAAGTVTVLLKAAAELHATDPHLAADTLLEAFSAAQLTGSRPLADERPVDVALAARALPVPAGAEPTAAHRLVDAVATVHLDGPAAARAQLRTAIAALDARGDHLDHNGRPISQVRLLGVGCWCASVLADDGEQLRVARRLEATARPHGAVTSLSVALLHLAMARLARGALPEARQHLAERAALQAAMGWPTDIGDLVREAWTGDAERARTESAHVADLAGATGHHWMLVFSDYAASVLELGLGRYAAALEPARRAYREHPDFVLVAFPNLVEAAVRADAPELAHEAIADLRARVGSQPTPLAGALLELADALTAHPSEAEVHFTAALALLPWADGTVRGRVALLYGEWLRRRKRKTDAREQLRDAYACLTSAGAGAFADRARRELAAAGDRTPGPVDGDPVGLTPQETQIARLATTGATNVEIAAQLFLSASTVDYHLRKVFKKVGVTSRRQLVEVRGLRELEDFHA